MRADGAPRRPCVSGSIPDRIAWQPVGAVKIKTKKDEVIYSKGRTNQPNKVGNLIEGCPPC